MKSNGKKQMPTKPKPKKRKLKKLRLKKSEPIDFILFAVILILVVIGVIMVFSASSYTSANDSKIKDGLFYLKKQAMWSVLGISCMIVFMKTDYHKLKKYIKPILLLTIVLLLAVFAFKPVNGARRWIPLGFASLQPSEITKYTVVLFLAASLDKKGEKVKSFIYGVMPYLMVASFFAGLVLAEKNLSIAAVIMGVTIIMLFVAEARISHLGLVIGVVVALGVTFILIEPYRMARVMYFLNPWQDAKDKGFQLVQSLLALGSGGVFGEGWFQSRQKCFWIPEPHTDFIFSIIGEELGLIGCAAIVLLFVVFIWRGMVTASKANDKLGKLLATGITAVIALQAIINMAVVTGSMPVTGVPLPFISYGGSSLIFNLIAMGVLLNISRHKPPVHSENDEK